MRSLKRVMETFWYIYEDRTQNVHYFETKYVYMYIGKI